MRAKTREDHRITYRPTPVRKKFIDSYKDKKNINQTNVIDLALDTLMQIQNFPEFVSSFDEMKQEIKNNKKDCDAKLEEIYFMLRTIITKGDSNG